MPLNNKDRAILDADPTMAKCFKTLSLFQLNVVRYVASANTVKGKIKRAKEVTEAIEPVIVLFRRSVGNCGPGCYWDDVSETCCCPTFATAEKTGTASRANAQRRPASDRKYRK
jgi:hypothetical protein